MRVRAIEHRHRLPERLKLGLIRLIGGRRVPDVVKTLMYRPEFFGRPQCAWTQAVMRGRPRGVSANASCSRPSPRSSINASSERSPTPRSRRWLWRMNGS